MTPGQRVAFWVALGLTLGVAINMLRSILLPFVLGGTLAFMLDPLVTWLSRRWLSRTVASLVVLLLSLLLLTLFAIAFVPVLERQLVQFIGRLPDYILIARHQIDHLLMVARSNLPPDQLKSLQDAAAAEVSDVAGKLGQLAESLLSGGLAIANLLSLFFITPIVTFFLLRDWPDILAGLDDAVPRPHLATVREQVREIERTLSGFIRGQALVSVLMAVYYALGLSLLGLESGLVIGVLCGVLIVVPYLGALTGSALSVLLLLAQGASWRLAIAVVLLFLIGQTVESNIITPKLVGDRVKLHPVWIIFSLLAFGALWGLVGLLIAVPVAAVLGVLIRFGLARYRESSIYDPVEAQAADPSI